MPGATVDSVDDDVVTGRVKVKVGPVALTYAGKARFTERDEQARSITLEASGKETRGAGTASATVRSWLEEEGDHTRVTVHTTMNVTGRPAQFGRGVMADVSSKLLGQFVACLEQNVISGGPASPGTATQSSDATTAPAPATAAAPAPATGAAPAPASSEPPRAPQASAVTTTPTPAGVRRIDAPEAAPVDLMSVAGSAVGKRVAIAVGAVVVIGVVIWLVTK